MVVFLHRTEPDLEFEGLLKRRHTQIKYLSVTVGSLFLILETDMIFVKKFTQPQFLAQKIYAKKA